MGDPVTPANGKAPAIRVGDRVRIVRPALFVRCGYPLTKADVREELKADEERRTRIETFASAEGVREDLRYRFVREVLDALAHAELKRRGMGGRTRTIHTEDEPEFVGRVATVVGVSFVKTGEYVPALHYSSLDGNEYDPAYLADEKTHRILRLADPCCQIEAANVERLPLVEGTR